MTTLKLMAIGSSIGVVIPQAMLDRMKIGNGDALFAVEEADGGYRLTTHDPALADKMERADDIIQRYSNTLHTLAK